MIQPFTNRVNAVFNIFQENVLTNAQRLRAVGPQWSPRRGKTCSVQQAATHRTYENKDLTCGILSGKVAITKLVTLRIADLVEPVRVDPPPLRLFLNYAHGDAKHLDELRKGLKVMERNGLLRAWYDGELIAGEPWEPRLLQELNEADVIVCQLRRDFLASDFIMLTEVATAFQRKESGDAELIAYVLKPCLWKQARFKEFQLIPKGAKPMGRNNDKFWLEVAVGLQKALEKLQQKRASRLGRDLLPWRSLR